MMMPDNILDRFKNFPKALADLAPYAYRAVVIDVHDGDTATVVCDRGRKDRSEWRIRLKGINAAELNDEDPQVRAAAYASRDYLRSLLPYGTRCVVQSFKRTYERTNEDRYVGVIIRDDGMDVAAEQVRAGYAVPVVV